MGLIKVNESPFILLMNTRGITCVPLTRLDRGGEDVYQGLFYFDCRFEGKCRCKTGKSVLFTLRDTHPLRRASLLSLVSPQALVACNFGPAAAAANLEAHV